MFAAIADEMGVVLRKTSYSPNIKERRDFSCALFDTQARMIAQAAHIPVHLGAMPLSVEAAIRKFGITSFFPGDVIVLNDPYIGEHTCLISPWLRQFFYPPEGATHRNLIGFVASRAHHADVAE